MRNHRVAYLPGDGIGPEVCDVARRCLDAAGERYGFSVTWDEQRVGGRLALGYRVTPDLSLTGTFRGENVKIFEPRVVGLVEAQIPVEMQSGIIPPDLVQPLDVIAKFEPLPEFNIYAGRMLVQADRFSPSGPWGIDEFFYPGFFMGVAGPPALPKAGPVGRDVGTTVWGAPFGGHFKYYAGAYQLQDPALSPLYSGRLQLSLLNPEPAFFQRTTYYGTKDLISLGVGGLGLGLGF